VANALYKDAQSILEIYHVKICFLLIHNPTAEYNAARKTLLHVVYNDGYILVFHFMQQKQCCQKQGIITLAEHISANVKISVIFNYCGIM